MGQHVRGKGRIPHWIRVGALVAASARSALTVAVLLVSLSACASGGLRSAVGEFHRVTSAAVKVQREELAGVTASDAERIRRELASNRVSIALSSDCAYPDAAPGSCRLVPLGDEQGSLPTPFTPGNILALGAALESYAEALADLAADASANSAAFSTSLGNLATKLGGLNGAIAGATNAPVVPQEKLGAVASIVATSGSLYFESARVAALRRIIVQSDESVQQATGILAETEQLLHAYTHYDQLAILDDAQRALEKAIRSGASVEEVGRRQDALFAAFAEFQRRTAVRDAFLALGDAHHKLAESARSSATLPELVDAIERLAQAAKAISQSVGTIAS